jgi:hypothetical protein
VNLYLNQTDAASTYASKTYVDQIQQGVSYKAAVDTKVDTVAAATTYLAAHTSSRVLVAAATPAPSNGIYVYDAAAGYKRSTDFDGDPLAEISPGAMVYVQDSGLAYICNSSDVPATNGSGAITSNIGWAVYSKAEVITASSGIARNGNALSLDVSATTFKDAVPYDVLLDVYGRPALNEILLTAQLPRAIKLSAPASHYVSALAAADRPTTSAVVSIKRNATVVLTLTYATDGSVTVAEPNGTDRSFSAGDYLYAVCTTYDATFKNPKATLVGSLA